MTLRRCFRCSGRKALFKVGGIYSLCDTGGILVDCPLCKGRGTIPSLDEIKKLAVSGRKMKKAPEDDAMPREETKKYKKNSKRAETELSNDAEKEARG